MKLRLPLLLRLALLSTAAAYTLGSGCLFADDAPADAAQDDPIAEAVDEEESDSPSIGFEGYTESQLVDIQSSDSAGAVIRQMLENSTTGAVANVGTTSSTSNGATSVAAESPALTLSAPAEPATDTALTTTTLSDSAGEGAVAPFFSAEEAAALVVASPATSTPLVKNASTATLSSSDTSDETTASAAANGAVSASLGSVGSAGASSGGGSASYSLTSSAPDSSSSSLVITTPTDDTPSDPIAEEVLEDSTTEDTTTSTTLPDSSTATLAGTSTTSTTTRTLPVLKLLGSTSETSTQGTVKVDGVDRPSSSKGSDNNKGVQFLYGTLGKDGSTENIIYLHANQTTYPSVVEVVAESFYICPAESSPVFEIKTLKTDTSAAIVKIQNNEWSDNYSSSLTLTLGALSINGSASLDVSKTQTGAISVSIGKVVNSSTESTTGPLLTSVTNSGTLTLGTNANPSENVEASSVSIGTLTNKANSTMTLNGVTTITEKLTNNGTLTNTGTLTVNSDATLVGKIDSTGTLNLNGEWNLTTVDHSADLLSNALKSTSQDSLGTVRLNCMSKDSDVYKLDTSLSTHGVSLKIEGTSTTYLNAWGTNSQGALIVEASSSLTTEGELRLESTAKLQVKNDSSVKIGGKLTLGHIDGGNYGHVILNGGKLEAKEITRSSEKDAVDSSKNTFRMSGGTLTLTKENAEISGVYTEISGGTLDTSQASWGISSSDASVGGVTVSDVKDGVGGNSGNALTLTGAKITGDISLEGTAGLVLKNVTVTGNDVKLGGDGRTVQVALGGLTVENSVTTKGNLEVATGNDLVVKGTYATSGADSSLKLQGEATASLQNGETVVATVSQQGTVADASATITGGVTMKYDSDSGKAVIAGAGNGSSATITNSLLTVASGSTLSLQNVILAGNTKISAGTAAAAAVALLDEASGESSGIATTVDLTESVIQLSKDNATPKTGSGGVNDLTKGTTLTKTGPAVGEGDTLTIQQDTAKVYTIDYTGATGVTLTGALTFDFDTFTVAGMTGSGYYLLNELLKEYDYVALRFAGEGVSVDPEKVEVTSKVTMGTNTVTSTGYVANTTTTSGVVVYFDSMALPEPTTSTLSLLALAALCARRRRSRTRAHAEHA